MEQELCFFNLKINECINSEIFLLDFNFNLDDKDQIEIEIKNSIKTQQDNFLSVDLKKLIFSLDHVLSILNKTESFCRLNIFFKKLSKKITVGFLENILCFFYSYISIKAKFLDCKKFIINFPQIISKNFFYIYEDENNLKTFEEFDYEKNAMEFFGIFK
jgi:hypothetical protein